MYACLHNLESNTGLIELAACFAPQIELTAPGTLVFSIDGLRRLIGTSYEIAAEIARQGSERGIVARLAIASNPDSAILAATNLPGVTVIPPGKESSYLGIVPLRQVPMSETLLEIFERWGLNTLGDIARIPPFGIAERLGDEGLRIYNLALGNTDRPLRLVPSSTSYLERMEVEYPLSNIEPLLFVLSRLLHELCSRLEANSINTNNITTKLELEDKSIWTRILELPVPQSQPAPLLKLLQLDLEAHPPSAPVTAVTLSMNPVGARRLQNELFVPRGPEPVKLQLTLTRISALVGCDNVGSPELLNTYRRDAFRIHPMPPAAAFDPRHQEERVRLAFRIFRPALPATVRLAGQVPRHVAAPSVTGNVTEAAGPWHSSGDWWTTYGWSREEWDVALTDGGLYRIWRTTDTRDWFIDGVYD